MLKKYIKSYEILPFEGLIELILGIITLIITTNIGYLDNFNDFIYNLNIKEIFLLILLIVCNFAFYLIEAIIIDIFSPFHVFLIRILLQIIYNFINLKENDLITFIITIIFTLICLFTILVFIEIIELNFLNLSYMTKKNIELRAQLDTNIANGEKNRTTSGEYDVNFNDNKSSYENELICLDNRVLNNE